jgi:hypothetical protein
MIFIGKILHSAMVPFSQGWKRSNITSVFIFENIYSYKNGKNNGLNEDSIHGNPPGDGKIPISYYFVDFNHPVVFVNTSNHAMAEHDANHKLWKWEYVPGIRDSPITLGNESRRTIDGEFDSSKSDQHFYRP